MKKLLPLILLLCLALPVCSEVTNEKQKKDDNILRGIINSDAGRLSKHQTSFKEDYSLFKRDDKNSIFMQLTSLEKKYKKKNDEKSQLNLSYIAKAKDLYLFLSEYPSELTMTSDFVNEFNSKIIFITDSDYDSLDEDLTMIISVINVYK